MEPAETAAPEASVVSSASSRIAIRSSTISTPKTASAILPVMRFSANALTTMVVLEIEIIAPPNTASSGVQPSARESE